MITLLIKILLLTFGFGLGFLGIFGKTYENGIITKMGRYVIVLISLVFIGGVVQEFLTYNKEQDEKREADSIKINQLRKSDSINSNQLKQYNTSIRKLDKIINDTKIQKSLINTLKKETDNIADIQDKLHDRNRELAQSTKKIAQSSKKLVQSTDDIYKNIVAKDSYCYIEIHMPSSYEEKAYIVLRHIGAYVLKDIEVSLINTDKFYKQKSQITAKDILEDAKFHGFTNPFNYKLSSMRSGERYVIGEIDVDHKRQKSFNVCFKSDNSTYTWYQRIVLRRVGDYPKNESFFADSASYQWASQLYKVQDILTAIRLMKSMKDFSSEIIVREGSDFIFNDVYYESDNITINDARKWLTFPTSKGETNPFNSVNSKLHWNCSVNRMPYYRESYNN